MNKTKKDWKTTNFARFICCLSLFWPNGKSYSSNGIVKGKISSKKKGNKGFGYDPIFYVPETDCHAAELDKATKHRLSHRGKAIAQFLQHMNL